MLKEINLKADEWFNIEGRGLVAALNIKDQIEFSDLCKYKNKKIRIDSEEYILFHIECMQNMFGGVFDNVGLVVGKVKDE